MHVKTRIALFLLASALLAPAAGAKPLRVVTTTPDLSALVQAVGGDQVEVTSLAKGPQDVHFVEPRPSFVRDLHRADVFVQTGMELEIGWAPVLLRQSRNPDIQQGGRGHIDASLAIVPLEVPAVPMDRSAGDVHPYGNPHYLTDPINGLRVAALLRDRLAELRPEAAAGFRERYAAFERELVSRLVGPELVDRHGAAALAARVQDGSLAGFLDQAGGTPQLGGWLAAVRSHAGTRAVQDHRLWPYFGGRFGIELIETLEPKPGIAPTTRHLAVVVERVRQEGARLILASPYFDPRHARFVSERTGAKVVEMAHQPGAREGTDDYLATVDYNVRQVLSAL
jgi:ABC-type Zn uptake system ZnuABC Zn-binding protein ZnuA